MKERRDGLWESESVGGRNQRQKNAEGGREIEWQGLWLSNLGQFPGVELWQGTGWSWSAKQSSS